MSFVIAGVNWGSDRDSGVRTVANLGVPAVDRRHVVSGDDVETAAAGSGAFAFWLGETGKHAAFPFIRVLVNSVFQPLLPVVNTLIYFAELFFAVTMTFGMLTRLGALFALGQATFLWLGLYQASNEWPWNYMFLMIVHGFFIVTAAGRCLGVDALLRRPGGAVDRFGDLPRRAIRAAT